MEIPVDQQFLDYSDQPSGTNNHSTFKVSYDTLILHTTDARFELVGADHLELVYMPKCFKLLPCDWLIIYLH